jgi:hypothetical protein
MLGLSPIAGPSVVGDALSGLNQAALPVSTCNQPTSTPLSEMEQAIQKAFQAFEDENPAYTPEMPTRIANKKSWSPVFKESIARKEHIIRRRRDTMLRDLVYGDQPVALKLAKLAKFGIKV